MLAKNLTCFVFLKHPFLRFALLPYYRWNKKYNCSGPPAFKSQSRVSLTKNYCIAVNIKIISSIIINIFIFKIQVLGSHDLKSHCHFWHGTLKNDWINFQPFCICTSMQKIRLFQLFSFEIQSILESHDQTGPTDFWKCPPNKFLISF